MKFLRFLNVLDPDADMLSPVRIQAWVATANAVLSMVDKASATTQAASLAWVAVAHTIHQFDKINRAKNAVRLGALNVRGS